MLWHTVDEPFLLVLYDIGLAPGATITLDVESRQPHNSTDVVILTMEQWSSWASSLQQQLSDGFFNEYLITYWRHPVQESLKLDYSIRDVGERHFVLGIYNPKMAKLEVSVKVGFVNPDGNHLPMQWTDVAPCCYKASWAFIILAFVTLAGMKMDRGSCPLLHLLLVLCMCLKSLSCSYTGLYLEHMSRYGVPPPFGVAKLLLVAELHDMSETLLLLLVSLGWRILRPRLSHTEMRFLMLAIMSGGSLSLLQVVTDGDDSLDAEGISVFHTLVKCTCYMVVFFASSVNIQLINNYLSDSPVGPSVASLYDKRMLYQRFRNIVIAIVVQPLIVLGFQALVFRGPALDQWMETAVGDCYQWILYCCLAITLRWGTNRRGYMKVLEYANRDAPPADSLPSQEGRSNHYSVRATGDHFATGRTSSSASTPGPPSELVYPPIFDGDYMPLPG